jgi:hypothetical protein
MEDFLDIFVLIAIILSSCVLCFLFFKIDHAINVINTMHREYPTVLNDLLDRNIRRSILSLKEEITPTTPIKPNNFKSFTRVSRMNPDERA